MTNLEWLARNTDDLYDCSFCELRSVAESIKALNEEHEEKQNG